MKAALGILDKPACVCVCVRVCLSLDIRQDRKGRVETLVQKNAQKENTARTNLAALLSWDIKGRADWKSNHLSRMAK